MLIQREIYHQLQHDARAFPAVAVLGPRQVGKTTALRHAFPTYHFVSLDVPADADMAESRPELFLAAHPAPVIIDEVQYAPLLLRDLKAYLDAQPTARGQVFTTWTLGA